MFQLNDGGAHFWYGIFRILSLEKADNFLHMIGFPLAHKSAAVEKLAQDFVVSLYEIHPQHFEPGFLGEPTTQVKHLFDQIYNMLSGELGAKRADLIVIWGNQLQALYGLSHSISIYHGLLVSLELGASIENFVLPALPDKRLQWLVSQDFRFVSSQRVTKVQMSQF